VTGRSPRCIERKREALKIYRSHDIVSTLSDEAFEMRLTFTRAAFIYFEKEG
jgi:hypothetical protein